MRLTSFLLTLAISTGSLSAQASYSLETVAENLNFPWSIAFTPEGDYLVAMRSGVVRRISAGGEVSPALEGLPASYVLSQGGYFDITLDPGFTDNQRIYLSFAYGTPELNGTRIVTGRLNGNPHASNGLGNAAVWSYGHRNPQGLVLDKMSGHLYSHEHGAKGGDELNLIKPDTNYGWPAVTKGVNYSGAYVSPLRSAPGIEEPLTYWDPSIGASGLAIYDGAAFPNWQGKLFIGALVDEEVRMLTLSEGKVTDEQAMFSEIGARIRDVRTGPDGMLYLLTDSEQGKVIRVVPSSDPVNQATLSAATTIMQGQQP